MRAPSPEKAAFACFPLTIRQPTTSAIRNRRRTRFARADSPLRARRSLTLQNRAAPPRRARIACGSATPARWLPHRTRLRPFSATADTAQVSPTLPCRSLHPKADAAEERLMSQDFKCAVRQLVKTPGFTAVAVLTLALAIGVNSAIFEMINSVVLRPMVPVRAQEVVNVFNGRQNANHDYRSFSYNEFRELREHGGDLFADVAALEFAVAGIG